MKINDPPVSLASWLLMIWKGIEESLEAGVNQVITVTPLTSSTNHSPTTKQQRESRDPGESVGVPGCLLFEDMISLFALSPSIQRRR